MKLNLLVYAILTLIGVMLIKHRKKLRFIYTTFYIFYITLIWMVFAKMWTSEDPHVWWSRHVCWFLDVKFKKMEGSHEICNKYKTLHLLNHRSWADFFTHDIVTEHNSNFLGRMLVAFIFPLVWLSTRRHNTVWYFVRGGRGENLEPFFKWIDSNFAHESTIRKSLIVYPEGHRNLKSEPLPLKTGMLRYAFERKCPVQIIMGFGIENAMNEKAKTVQRRGNIVQYYVDEAIDSTKFANVLEFNTYIEARFREKFKEILSLSTKKVN